jgi:hypothetical protein
MRVDESLTSNTEQEFQFSSTFIVEELHACSFSCSFGGKRINIVGVEIYQQWLPFSLEIARE